jgi:hypothetical protein
MTQVATATTTNRRCESFGFTRLVFCGRLRASPRRPDQLVIQWRVIQ